MSTLFKCLKLSREIIATCGTGEDKRELRICGSPLPGVTKCKNAYAVTAMDSVEYSAKQQS